MPLKKNLVASYLGQGITGLMSLAFVPIYISHLGSDGYGLVGFYAVLLSFLIAVDISISMTLGREMAKYTGGLHSHESIQDFVRSAEVLILLVVLVAGSLFLLAAGWISENWVHANSLQHSEIRNAIMMMGVILGFRLFEGLYRGCLLGLQKQLTLNFLSSSLATFRWGGAAAVLVWLDATVTSFFAWQCIASACATVLYRTAMIRSFAAPHRRSRFSGQALWNEKTFFGAMLVTYGLGFVVTQADRIILSKTISLETFGHYTFAALVASVLSMVAAPVAQALFPMLTVHASRNDTRKLSETYHLGAQLLTVLLTPPALMLILFGQDLLVAWTGDQTLSSYVAPMLQVLAIGTLLNGYMAIPHTLQLASGWAGLSARINVVAVLILVPAVAWIAPRYGAQGTAWAWVALNTCYVAIGVPIMHRRLLVKDMRRWCFQDIAQPAVAAAAVVLISLICRPGGMGSLATWTWLIATGLLGVMAASVGAPDVRRYLLSALTRRQPTIP